MEKYDVAIYIGRFQPFHNGHLEVIKTTLDQIAKRCIVLIGSASGPPSFKNPFTYQERAFMIRGALDDLMERVTVYPVDDFFYDEKLWALTVKNIVNQDAGNRSTKVLVGHYRDDSSYYLRQFTDWKFRSVTQVGDLKLSSTQIRTEMIKNPSSAPREWGDKELGNYDWKNKIPSFVARWLLSDYTKTERFKDVCDEYHYAENYKAQWAKAPYPPTFITADCVVCVCRHIALVKRGGPLGRNLWALPGGFVKSNEACSETAKRELMEETGLRIDEDDIREYEIFDFPNRSLRGRTITIGYYATPALAATSHSLPDLFAGDDAVDARWFSVAAIYNMREQLFEDHFHIIDHFLTGAR